MSKSLLFFLTVVALLIAVTVFLKFRSPLDLYQQKIAENAKAGSPDVVALKALVSRMLIAPPAIKELDQQLAVLGRALFSDVRLSKNGAVSCATCHKPELSFTDGLDVAHGIGVLRRNTPSVVNSFGIFWFFWDGRADSLAAQVFGPLENPNEQGLSRAEIVRHVLTNYTELYHQLFGAVPAEFLASLPLIATPEPIGHVVSEVVARTAAASVTDGEFVKKLAQKHHSDLPDATVQNLSALIAKDEPADPDASENYRMLAPGYKRLLNQIAANIGLAIEAFEKGLVADQSPFDLFARTWLQSPAVDPAVLFTPDFSSRELLGLQTFLGKGDCSMCHTGAFLSDSQFHNIGLPQLGNFLEIGRSLGVVSVTADPFNCRGIYADLKDRQTSESCLDLNFLNKDSPEGIGAFKTPMLRNVALTAPYMHDGRFTSLRQVLDHYNRMDTLSAVGFREETLKPLNLDEFEMEGLEAFLIALTSPVRDINLTGQAP